MRGLQKNWKGLVIPVILIILAAWIWGPVVGALSGILFAVGLLAGLNWI